MDEAFLRTVAAAERPRLLGLGENWDGQGAVPPTAATFDAALAAAAAEVRGFLPDAWVGEVFFYPGFDGEVEIDLLRGRDRLVVVASPARPLFKFRKSIEGDLASRLAQFRAKFLGAGDGYADDDEMTGTRAPSPASIAAAAAFATALVAASPLIRRAGALPTFSDDTDGGVDVQWRLGHVFDLLGNFAAADAAFSLFSRGWDFSARFPAGLGPADVEWLAHLVNLDPGWGSPPYPAPPGAAPDFGQEPSKLASRW